MDRTIKEVYSFFGLIYIMTIQFFLYECRFFIDEGDRTEIEQYFL